MDDGRSNSGGSAQKVWAFFSPHWDTGAGAHLRACGVHTCQDRWLVRTGSARGVQSVAMRVGSMDHVRAHNTPAWTRRAHSGETRREPCLRMAADVHAYELYTLEIFIVSRSQNVSFHTGP
jgi:hypothetical protein